jgi:hypothetical protein
MATSSRWRMEAKCSDCPFASRGPGLRLRRSLKPGRWAEITGGLLNGQHFTCHKTTHETGDGTELMCAGSIEWCDRRGISTNLQRIMERLDYMFKKRRKT